MMKYCPGHRCHCNDDLSACFTCLHWRKAEIIPFKKTYVHNILPFMWRLKKTSHLPPSSESQTLLNLTLAVQLSNISRCPRPPPILPSSSPSCLERQVSSFTSLQHKTLFLRPACVLKRLPGEFRRRSHVSGVSTKLPYTDIHLHRRKKKFKKLWEKKIKWLFLRVDCNKQYVPVPQAQSKTLCFPSGPANQSSPDREILDSLGLWVKY